MADEEAKVLAEARGLPLDERVAHSAWRARSEAYDEVKAKCDRVLEEGDASLSELGSYSALRRALTAPRRAGGSRVDNRH